LAEQLVEAPDESMAISIRRLDRTYRSGGTEVAVLRQLDLDVAWGEMVAVVGPSGTGKTTLLNIVAGLDRPDSGTVFVDGIDLSTLSSRERTRLRARKVGFVFQDAHLIEGLNALENVAIGSMLNMPRRLLDEESRRALAAVGLAERAAFPSGRLSGGERQRVAIARALVGNRSILIADEPTGDLDSKSTDRLLDLLGTVRRERGLTILVATHDAAVATAADRAIRLADGRLTSPVGTA
jgi:ABC-type lipoprotein export system ATPase subunit